MQSLSFAGRYARKGPLHANVGSSVSAPTGAIDSHACIPNECIPSYCLCAAPKGANFYGKSASDACPKYNKELQLLLNLIRQEGPLNQTIRYPYFQTECTTTTQ
eukprot:6454971-Amphidinium_carterae.1